MPPFSFLKQDIRANGSLHGGLDGGHTRAVGSGSAGDGDDGGEGHILVAGNVLGNSLGVVLHNEDDGIGLILSQRMEDFRGGLLYRFFNNFSPIELLLRF